MFLFTLFGCSIILKLSLNILGIAGGLSVWFDDLPWLTQAFMSIIFGLFLIKITKNHPHGSIAVIKYPYKDDDGKEKTGEINLVYLFIGAAFLLALFVSPKEYTYSYGYGWAGSNYVSDYTECKDEFGVGDAVAGCRDYIDENVTDTSTDETDATTPSTESSTKEWWED